ncbi:MAG TPA: Gfo/Idh/MocA family oxidoreductase [Oculatellaceae cyanobacterium]
MLSSPLKIGMVGAGFIGQLAHLMNYSQLPNCKVTAIAEMRPILRKKVMEHYEIDKGYEHHTEMLKDPDVNAVVVVTPRAFTANIVSDCLTAKKHVISEKPMAGTSEQAARLVALAAQNELVYSVGYMKRYDEGVQFVKKYLEDGKAQRELGDLTFVRAHCFMGDSYCKADGHVVTDEKATYEDAGWPMAPDWLPEHLVAQYAAFVNCFSHNTNILRYLLGCEPTIGYADTSNPNAQMTALKFNEVLCSLETGKSTNRGWDESTELFFTDGRITIKTPPPLLKNVPAHVEIYRAGQTQEVYIPQFPWTWSFRRQASAFVEDVLHGRTSISSGMDSLNDLRLIESIWQNSLGIDTQ